MLIALSRMLEPDFAKAVNAQAAIAIPVPDQQGGVRAVVGIAFQEERDFTRAEIAQFTAAASSLPD